MKMKLRMRMTETNEGIQDGGIVDQFDQMMRTMVGERRRTVEKLQCLGIEGGWALEIGPGPGYLGIDWLKASPKSKLTALEISPNMLRKAEQNALREGVKERVTYVLGTALRMPFPDRTFDFIFSNGSLHEWEQPEAVFKEIFRVLKPEGVFLVSDLKRNATGFARFLMKATVKPKTMRPGLISSLQAAYTSAEIKQILSRSGWQTARVTENAFGLNIEGRKTS